MSAKKNLFPVLNAMHSFDGVKITGQSVFNFLLGFLGITHPGTLSASLALSLDLDVSLAWIPGLPGGGQLILEVFGDRSEDWMAWEISYCHRVLSWELKLPYKGWRKTCIPIPE